MLINCQRDSAKVAPNTNRLNFAGNNLEYNNLKASTLTLHVTKSQSIKPYCVQIMHFKNCDIY